ncbi:uncharacterized protein LOC130782347 [Actinidia eriantha]|uniref:uncharacterized protein LOC130782347 n=1 Tax=Actinidia eriantha TaxID=165200 RepID=UPI0025859CD9|nr:uncharacterized protein LOC130782347 [Actinidia eriantha]
MQICLRDINTGNIPFVNTVFLFFENTHPRSRNHSISAVKVLRELCDMKSLALSAWTIEFLFSKHSNQLTHLNANSFNSLRDATLCMWPVKHHVQKTISLLTRFQNLRTLFIFICELEQPPYMLFYLEMNSQDFSCTKLLNHLEYVEIRNFEGCDSELEIVEFLLNNAKVLVEMKLTARERRDHTGLTVGINCANIRSINKKLLAMRRASSRAKILFSYIM